MRQDDLDIDPFVSTNGTQEENIPGHLLSVYFIKDIVYLITCILSIVVNVFIFIIILKFKRLRIRSNMYILNSVFICVFVFLTTACIILIDCFEYSYSVFSYHLFVFITQTHSTFLVIYVSMGLLLVLDWYTSGQKPSFIYYYNRYYKYACAAVYLIGFIEWAIAFAYAEFHHIIRGMVMDIMYIIAVIILMVINILNRVKSSSEDSKRTSYSLTVSNIIIFSIMPLYAYNTIFHFPYIDIFSEIIIIVDFLGRLVWLIHPILIMYFMKKESKYFRIAFMKFFNKSVSDYDNDELNQDSEVFTYHDRSEENSVHANI